MTDQTTTDFKRASEAMPLNWKWTFALGCLFLVGGLLAFANPFVASLTAEAIAAAFFFLGGLMQVWMAVTGTGQSTGRRVAEGLIGIVLILFAISLMLNPLAGLISLTLLVAAFFLVAGILRIWLGLSSRSTRGWGWMVAAGVMSVALAALIFFALPAASLSVLGLLLAIDLTVSGIAAIAMALQARGS